MTGEILDYAHNPEVGEIASSERYPLPLTALTDGSKLVA
jgi:hypothetical protein